MRISDWSSDVCSSDLAWRVGVLTANCDVAELAKLAKEFRPDLAVVADEICHAALSESLAGTGIETAAAAAAPFAAAPPPTDLVMAAIVGTAGLEIGKAAGRERECQPV